MKILTLSMMVLKVQFSNKEIKSNLEVNRNWVKTNRKIKSSQKVLAYLISIIILIQMYSKKTSNKQCQFSIQNNKIKNKPQISIQIKSKKNLRWIPIIKKNLNLLSLEEQLRPKTFLVAQNRPLD